MKEEEAGEWLKKLYIIHKRECLLANIHLQSDFKTWMIKEIILKVSLYNFQKIDLAMYDIIRTTRYAIEHYII